MLLALVRDSGGLLPGYKSSEHAGPGVTPPAVILALAEKHSGFPGSISEGHGAMKHLQVFWRGTTNPACSLFCLNTSESADNLNSKGKISTPLLLNSVELF